MDDWVRGILNNALKHYHMEGDRTRNPNTRLPTQGLQVRSPLTPTKITKRRYVLVLPRKNASVYQCFTLGALKNLVCHVWWALQYLALWATNRTKHLYARRRMGKARVRR